jgi:hypothetical protein
VGHHALDRGVSSAQCVLRKKAGHGYGLADRPFVIAVLCAGDFVDEHDIAQTLFGPIEYETPHLVRPTPAPMLRSIIDVM